MNSLHTTHLKKYFPTEAGLIKMIYHDTHDPVLIQAKVWFAFGCYSGLRISDMKLFNYDEHVKAGRLLLRPSKKSKGWVSMPVCNDLKRLLHEYRNTHLRQKKQPSTKK